MTFEDVWSDLANIYRDRRDERPFFSSHLTTEDVDRWSAALGISRVDMCDQIVKHLARGYQKKDFDFILCDAIVNQLSAVATDTPPPRPEFFWKVYWAFDAGEYDRDNRRDEEPDEVYTRPLIEDLVKTIV